MNLIGGGFQKLEHQTQTDKCHRTHYHDTFAGGNNEKRPEIWIRGHGLGPLGGGGKSLGTVGLERTDKPHCLVNRGSRVHRSSFPRSLQAEK